MRFDSIWELLEARETSVLEKWRGLILKSYPPDTASFLQREGDRFVNPVGYVIARETKIIYNQLLGDMDPARLGASVEEIMKIRAVQDFNPSQAVGAIFLLKQAVREEMASEVKSQHFGAGLFDFESRIDRLALLAFDVYMKCREKVCEIRVNEALNQRDNAWRILAAAGPICETGETE